MTLKRIKYAQRYVKTHKKRTLSKESILYNKVNKKYKKIDWNVKKFRYKQLQEILQNSALHCFYRLVKDKHLRNHNVGQGYLKDNVEKLFLMQELMCQMDFKFWVNTHNKKKKQKPWRPQYVRFQFDSLYLGKIYICTIPKSKIEKSKLVTQYLHTKEYLFDQDNEYFKGLKRVKYFICKNLINGKIQKWDFYLKRFLAENN